MKEKYLEHEICAVSGNWLVVYDGKYNYMLFDSSYKPIIERRKHRRMPYNNLGSKQVEYYSTFDNAINNLAKVVTNGGFLC